MTTLQNHTFRVWGEDANEFKLRDLKKYIEIGTPCIWATKMVDEKNPENNRMCPAYDLSWVMGKTWMKSFLARKDKFTLEDNSNIKIDADGPGFYPFFEFKTLTSEREKSVLSIPSIS